MFFPIGTDCPQRRFPWMNALLILLNVVIYFVTTHMGGPVGPDGLSLLVSKYILYPGKQIELYQFVTYQFLHQGIYHLLGNMVFLYVFGNNLNEKLGHAAYLAFYLAGGVFAGCGQVMTSQAPTLGASGAISAVAGLFLFLLPRTNVRMLVWIFFYVDVVEIPSLWFILFSVAKDLFEPYLFSFGKSNVAHVAHLSGYLTGFVVGAILLATHMVPRDHYDLMAMVQRWRRRREYQQLVAQGNDPFSGTYARPKPSPATKLTVDPRAVELRDAIMALLHTHQLPAAAARYVELKALDAAAVLAAQDQLDIANQLMSAGQYEHAAKAYEDYLAQYRSPEPPEHIQLLLGLIYARYILKPERAVELLKAALTKLHDPGRRALAEGELAKLAGTAG